MSEYEFERKNIGSNLTSSERKALLKQIPSIVSFCLERPSLVQVHMEREIVRSVLVKRGMKISQARYYAREAFCNIEPYILRDIEEEFERQKKKDG